LLELEFLLIQKRLRGKRLKTHLLFQIVKKR